MIDPTPDLPASIRDEVRHILTTIVAGGAARFKKNGDRKGSQGQKEISQLLKGKGIGESNPLWMAVRQYGRDLYYDRESNKSAAPQQKATPLTDGHRRTVGWMATPAFREIVTRHREACGNRMTIYFRPTDQGVVRIALHLKAPGYVSFRIDASDNTFLLRPFCAVPSVSSLQERLDAFESYLPTMTRGPEEEQGVIPFLRSALDSDLSLPNLGPGWFFLHQEWRWALDGGKGKKSDILAVHVPTGQLGIVEFKSSEAKLPEARCQVDEYADLWRRHAGELAPFFTDLLRAMGAAYGNDSLLNVKVNSGPAKLYVGVAAPRRLQVYPR